MTKYPDLWAALAAEFDPHEVKQRSQAGRTFQYVTARTVMNRLDAVLGPESWWDRYQPGEHSVLCRLTILLPDGRELTKEDAGGYAGMSDDGDDSKSGFSDAFKRAAAKFGVARYLYRDGVPTYTTQDGEVVNGHAPAPVTPPTVTYPEPERPEPRRDPRSNGSNGHGGGGGGKGNGHNGPPRSGKALYAWTKDQEQQHEVGLLKYLNNWAKLQDFPGRMIDFTPEQTALAYAEACRKLAAVGGS